MVILPMSSKVKSGHECQTDLFAFCEGSDLKIIVETCLWAKILHWFNHTLVSVKEVIKQV